jgi:amino acid adenylation domain-containing protein
VGLPEEVRSRYPGSQVVSLGGATEAAVWSNVYPIGEVGREWRSIPYGRPIGNARYLIVDGDGELCPIGVPGDLYIGGECLSSGYAGEAGLTAERFVPSFFGQAGERLYRTGDRARFWRDGTMEFLGRRDQQVKVRGFRVELGEIESALVEHPGVSEAVVSAWEDSSGHKRLVAYLVGRGGGSPESFELRRFLSERLPAYMVPSVYVALESLPVTSNGKLDRRALPSPVGSRPEEARSYTAPRTPVEELLADLWAEVLRLDRVGIHDNFFEIGGHSLLAVRAVSKLREVLGFDLFLRTFFEAPTVAELAAQIGAAGPSDRPELRQPISRISRQGELPLSFGQQRLWFLDLLAPESPLYNLPVALRLRGDLDRAVLEKVLTELVRRHEALRTVFPPAGGQPVQTILPPSGVALATIDLNGLGAQVDGELLRLVAADARRAFDLAAGPLFRASLVRMGREDHALLLALHHIVGDGLSMGILLKELGELYVSFAAGQPSPLPDLPIQYADFAAWQQRLLGETLGRQLGLWKERLAHLPPLELPTDRPRPAEQRFRGATQRLVLAADTAVAVREIGRREGATPFMVLLGAFGALLGALGRQEDVAVGSPVAGRSRPETEGLIGFFVNTLVLRMDLSAAPRVHDLLARVRETCLAAYDSQDVPFERLVEELRPDRDLSRSPLFQAMLALEPELPVPALRGLAAEYLGLDTGTSKLDLLLSLSQPGGRFEGSWEFDTDLFDRVTVQRWSASFQALLAAIVADPSLPIAELSLLSAAQRQQMLQEWQGAQERVLPGCLHDPFFVQAELTPEAVAVVAGEARITYRELARRARLLAARLRRLGVGPEVPVGLCAERTPELLVGVLGVLAAGGAYLPLDPAYPAARLAFALEDSRAPIVLASAATLDRLPPSHARIVRLDAEEEPPAADEGAVFAAWAGPDNLSHVIYTSGSTGRPKGVAIEHRSARALLTWAEEVFAVVEVSRVLFSTSICFDLSVFELFVPWSRGGAVVLAESALQLPELPARDEVTLVNTVPLILSELLRNGGVPDAVRVINLAGEPLRADLVRRIERLGTVEKVFNLYGPTEDTTYSTWVRVDGRPGAPSIGRPIGGTRAYVMDGGLQPLPPGVVGELCLGGLGLARGYLGRPMLTAEQFVPDPFAVIPGERLYRTGDLCRLRRDGEIEILGRLDHQVKLRGFRIELGEIEAALMSCPGVREGVVLLRDGVGGARLIAYVGVEESTASGAAALRRLLEEKLPSHMVPSAFMFLAALPRTPNGKLDRKALPAPEEPRTAAVPAVLQTEVEDLLSGIWAEVLGCEGIGRNEDFFARGGHSLLATRVLSRVREVFQIELPLRAVFQQPTLAGLARIIEQAMESRVAGPQPPIVPVSREGDLPLSFAQQRLWAVDQIERGALYNIPIAVHLRGQLHVPALRQAVEEIVRRHEVLRTTFPAAQGRPRQRISPAGSWRLPVVDLAGLEPAQRETEKAHLAAEEAMRLFDLAQGPLLRTTLLRLGRQSHIALVTMHHIVSDAWSVGILVRELTAFYRAGGDMRASVLPDLPVQYADFAAWQRLMLQGEPLESLLAYWREQLAGLPPRLDLPTDRPRGERWSGRGSAHTVHLPAPIAAELRALSRRQNATLFMVLFAGFQLLLSRHTGQQDIVVATDVAGRARLEIEPLIGFFVNLLVLRTRMEGSSIFTELLRRVRETSLGAYAHQDLPFDRLIKELQPDRPTSGTPLVQVELLMQNTPREDPALPGLELSLVDGETRWAKFDLAVFVSEEPQGLNITWNYATDLFDGRTIARWASQYARLLEAIVRQPEAGLTDLEILSEEEQEERRLQKGGREARLRQLMKTSRAEPATERRVELSTLEPGKILPLVVRPLEDGVELTAWVAANPSLIERRLLEHGAILFRDFHLGSQADFDRGDLFHCPQVAVEGGDILLVDCREASRRLDSQIVDRLRRQEVLCIRNFATGSGVSWQRWFGIDDESVVEDFCRRSGIEVEWRSGGGLRTKQLCIAIVRHPETSEDLLCHQLLLHHLSCREPGALEPATAPRSPEDLPCSVCYGEGSPIESSVLEAIGRVSQESAVSFLCQDGDVILLDNMLIAQDHNPYMGPRKLVVTRAS